MAIESDRARASRRRGRRGRRERARDRWDAAADWSWGIIRRVHLGTKQPGNWVQLFHFGVVGGTGYVVNLIVFTLLTGAADLTICSPRSAPSPSR